MLSKRGQVPLEEDADHPTSKDFLLALEQIDFRLQIDDFLG